MTCPDSTDSNRTDRQAETLNRDCRCISVDAAALRHELESVVQNEALYHTIEQERPHMFSPFAVFVSREHAAHMAGIIRAVETVIALPAYRAHVLSWAPRNALFDPGTPGVFLGYDFHLGPAGPQLIEINTNAGGALLNTVLARAQRVCCQEMNDMAVGPVALESMERAFVDMFQAEWRCAHADRPLRTIAIIDDAPTTQFLYPEFLLFQQMFRRHGLECIIADPQDLQPRAGVLTVNDREIDLIYNRLTDFSLDLPKHADLLAAWQQRQVVVTPHPRTHALYADKRNLTALTDADLLRSWNVPATILDTLLGGIPRTVRVTPADADRLWAGRKQLFFKPASGYGSKAAYRGDKLTKRAWSDILLGEYVAQALVAPSERHLRVADEDVLLKMDLRNYVYDGQVQLLASRLYQGQTTNFRTRGGGFAPVFCPRK